MAQVLRRGLPTCLVLTMTDELHARGGSLDLPHLERALGIPVLGVVGHRGLGLDALRALLARARELAAPAPAAARATPPSAPRWAASVLAHVAASRARRAAALTEADRPRRAAPARGQRCSSRW